MNNSPENSIGSHEMNSYPVPFNSPFELGIRMVFILMAVYPRTLDLQQLLFLDYAAIYSGDLNGPESLHTPVPLRGAEYTTRRTVIEQGLYMMSVRRFIDVKFGNSGIEYQAGENASAIMGIIGGTYSLKLKERCVWVAKNLADKSAVELQKLFTHVGHRWGAEFVSPSDFSEE
jgi:hypothetical protein